MSATRHLTQLISIDFTLFAREALKTSIIKSQGAMNFLFIRIYKSANVEHLSTENHKKWRKIIKNFENSYTQNISFIAYNLKKEMFKKLVRDLFMPFTKLEMISHYFTLQRSSEAGLSTASLLSYDIDTKNHYWGRFLAEPIIHKFDVLEKKCMLSEISETHTSYCEPLDVREIHEESESDSNEEYYALSRTVNVPNVQKLEEVWRNIRHSKSENLSQASDTTSESEFMFNGKIIKLTNSDLFSFSSESEAFF